MHHKKLTDRKKSFLIKTMFFLGLICFSILMYFESRKLDDAIYLMIVLVLFIRFLVVKLYQ